MHFKKKLSLLLLPFMCIMSLSFARAQEIPPDTDNSSQGDGIDKDEIKKKLRANFFLDFDWGEEVLNLTPHPNNSAFYEAASDTLVLGDYSKGFRVVKYYEVDAGVGGKLTWFWPNKTGLAGKFWAYVGLMPMAGKTSVSNQFQPTYEKAMDAKARKIPMTAADFNSWAIDDSVNYSSTGGLIFSVGVGMPGVNIGTDFIVQGTFSTYVEKVSQDEVYVMISNTNAKSLLKQVEGSVVRVGVTKYKEIEQGMSYMIKYNDPVGKMAYNDLIRGNVAAIEMLLQDSSQTAVQKWEKLNRVQMRRLSHFNFGIPFIMNWGWTSGNIYELSNTRAFYDNTRAEVDYGVYIKEKRKKVFGSKAVKTESFYGSVFRLYSYDNDLMAKHIFGQYVFNGDDNKTKTKDMNKTINNLIEKTGLSQQLALNIPQYKKLKFSRINLEVNFDEDQTLKFMEAAAAMTPEVIADRANRIAQDFLMNESQTLALCTPEETEVPMSRDVCLSKYTQENTEASSSLVKAARVMKTHFEAGHDKEFSMAYAEFGKAMLKNATMFQAILGMAGSGAEIIYNVQNTFFQNYRVIYLTTDQAGVYIRQIKGQKNTVIFSQQGLNDALNVATGF